jgi:hypothetical protein
MPSRQKQIPWLSVSVPLDLFSVGLEQRADMSHGREEMWHISQYGSQET